MVCFRNHMAQGRHWCHEDLISLHFSCLSISHSLPHALFTSFRGSLWWPWKLQTQILLTACRPRGEHDAFSPLVPWKSSLALNWLQVNVHHSPQSNCLMEKSGFWLTKPELTSVPPLSTINAIWSLKWNQFSPKYKDWELETGPPEQGWDAVTWRRIYGC